MKSKRKEQICDETSRFMESILFIWNVMCAVVWFALFLISTGTIIKIVITICLLICITFAIDSYQKAWGKKK